ncbi:MAG TPA: phytanoyl-CoA dioxygenase family protein [Pirellulales bacterium]|jgi:ectoine hydroxylase-related dioxygenase (phytanoyl-CoA dioxygenase family)
MTNRGNELVQAQPASGIAQKLAADGYAIVEECLDSEVTSWLIKAVESCERLATNRAIRRRNEVFAVRNLLDVVPEVADIFLLPRVRELLREVVGPRPFLTKAILFDKTSSANWHVNWHQDLSIAGKQRADMPNWTGWSTKAEVPHVQPPAEVLEGMVTVRLHLDPCKENCGALKVIPGSHREGRLSVAQVAQLVKDTSFVTCSVCAGAAVIMKPLLLHASSPARNAAHRRVLHLEFAPNTLPAPLEWVYGSIQLDP